MESLLVTSNRKIQVEMAKGSFVIIVGLTVGWYIDCLKSEYSANFLQPSVFVSLIHSQIANMLFRAA